MTPNNQLVSTEFFLYQYPVTFQLHNYLEIAKRANKTDGKCTRVKRVFVGDIQRGKIVELEPDKDCGNCWPLTLHLKLDDTASQVLDGEKD